MSIVFDHLSMRYDEQPVISDLSLELPENGIIGFFGPSGCGKTTFLHLAAGLIRPDSGVIRGLEELRIGVVFQEDRLLPWLTAAENLDLIIHDRNVTAGWLGKVHLSGQADYYPSELSGGMKRRIALVRALAFDSDLLLLDEPFQGLDQSLKNLFSGWIREASAFKPVLLVSHDWAEIEDLSDRIYKVEGPPMTAERIK